MDMNRGPGEEREERGMCSNYYCVVHVVKRGDTLYKLSRQYGVKLSAIMMANPFLDIYNLRIGDEVCIPRLRRSADQGQDEM